MKLIINKRKKSILLSLGSLLIIPFLISGFLISQTESPISPDEYIVETKIEEYVNTHLPKGSGIANSPDLECTMFPIILNMEDYTSIASELNGMDYTNIRIAYYSEDYQWINVPYQIDEIAWPYHWENDPEYDPNTSGSDPNPGLYQWKFYVPFGCSYSNITDEQIGAIDGTDELSFYAYNGRQVSNYLWMNPSEFSDRIEVHITDPHGSGGESWMYIYYTSSDLGDISGETWYQDYVTWDSANLEITTPIYSLKYDSTNYDLVNEIKINNTSESNLVSEVGKSFRQLELDLGWFGSYPWNTWAEGTWSAGDGFSNPDTYDRLNTAFDDPTSPYTESNKGNLANPPLEDSNDVSEAGDHQAVIDGPIRVIMYRPTHQWSYMGSVLGNDMANSEIFPNLWEKYYFNTWEKKSPYYTVDVPPDNIVTPTLYVLYAYQEIIEIDDLIRGDLSVYFGADSTNPWYSQFTDGVKICYPDGDSGNDDYTTEGDPTIEGSDVVGTPNHLDAPDWQMVTSSTHGGFWRYNCRENTTNGVEVRETNFYWHDGQISEWGMQGEYGESDGEITGPTELQTGQKYYTIFGDFQPDTNTNIYNKGDKYQDLIEAWKINDDGLATNSTFTLQSKPVGSIFEVITPERLNFIPENEKLVFNIKCDDTGYSLSADFSNIDNNYNSGDEIVTEVGSNFYQINYTLSNGNLIEDGYYLIPFTVDGNVDSTTIYIELTETNLGQMTSISTTRTSIIQGETGLLIDVILNNPSSTDIDINEINLQFTETSSGIDVTDEYIISSTPIILPYTMSAANSTDIPFSFTVDVNSTATLGDITINATATIVESKYETIVHRNGADIIDSWTVLDASVDNTIPNIINPSANPTTVNTSDIVSFSVKIIEYDPSCVVYATIRNSSTGAWITSIELTDSDDDEIYDGDWNTIGYIGTYNISINATDSSLNYNSTLDFETITVNTKSPIIDVIGIGTNVYINGTNNITIGFGIKTDVEIAIDDIDINFGSQGGLNNSLFTKLNGSISYNLQASGSEYQYFEMIYEVSDSAPLNETGIPWWVDLTYTPFGGGQTSDIFAITQTSCWIKIITVPFITETYIETHGDIYFDGNNDGDLTFYVSIADNNNFTAYLNLNYYGLGIHEMIWDETNNNFTYTNTFDFEEGIYDCSLISIIFNSTVYLDLEYEFMGGILTGIIQVDETDPIIDLNSIIFPNTIDLAVESQITILVNVSDAISEISFVNVSINCDNRIDLEMIDLGLGVYGLNITMDEILLLNPSYNEYNWIEITDIISEDSVGNRLTQHVTSYIVELIDETSVDLSLDGINLNIAGQVISSLDPIELPAEEYIEIYVQLEDVGGIYSSGIQEIKIYYCIDDESSSNFKEWEYFKLNPLGNYTYYGIIPNDESVGHGNDITIRMVLYAVDFAGNEAISQELSGEFGGSIGELPSYIIMSFALASVAFGFLYRIMKRKTVTIVDKVNIRGGNGK